MTTRKIYDVAVVGAGMFGSAAAKYLSKQGLKVAVVGPAEPASKAAAEVQRVFGAYYDQARITRRLGWDQVWGTTDSRSMNRFADLEEESGVNFFNEVGSLVVMASSIKSRTDKIVQQCQEEKISVQRLSATKLSERFPYLQMPPIVGGVEGLYEERLAGYLNPRQLVKAQLKLAEQAGAELVRGTVQGIVQDKRTGLRTVGIIDSPILSVQAKRVLVAAGAFSNFNNLLQDSEKVKLHSFTEPNLLYEIDENEAMRLKGMPATVTVDPEDTGAKNMSVYLVPPVQYPDGKWYVRIGPGMQPIVSELKTLEEMRDWYLSQEITSEQRSFLEHMMDTLLPDIRVKAVRTASCIIEKTPTRYFYSGSVSDDENVHVIVGGNGHGARGSDEIGRLAAKTLMGDTWDFPTPYEKFRPRLMTEGTDESDLGFLRPPFGLC